MCWSRRARAISQLYEYYYWEILNAEDEIDWRYADRQTHFDALTEWIKERMV
jgi:hypothetical protein